MAKWVDEGENEVANILFGSGSTWTTTYLGLYEDASEPAETATLSGLAEQSGFNYSRQPLTRGTWTVTTDYAQYAQQTFSASGGDWGNQYGYFIGTTSDDSGKLLAVEQFSNGPYNVVSGGSVKVTPKITVA